MRALHPVHPWISIEYAPVYLLEYPTGSEDGYFEQLAEMYAAMLSWLERTSVRHATVSDLRKLASTARGRQMASEYYQQTRRFEGTKLAARGYITADERNRHVITAVTWQAQGEPAGEIPKAFFSEKHSAIVWARAQL